LKDTYQLLPPLSAEEYEALKADIAARGILVPVEYDEDGNILDGHHRVKIADELGITYPRLIRPFPDEEAKVEHVLALNLTRRHLSLAQKREVVKGLRERGMSVRKIADATGIPKTTVGRYVAPTVPFGTPERGHPDYPIFFVLECLAAKGFWTVSDDERWPVGFRQQMARKNPKHRVASSAPDPDSEFNAGLEDFEDVLDGAWAGIKTGKIPPAPGRWWGDVPGALTTTQFRDARFAMGVYEILCMVAAGSLLNWLEGGGDPDALGIKNEPREPLTDEEAAAFFAHPERLFGAREKVAILDA
jgi:ParB/Sulfiredoxin domain